MKLAGFPIAACLIAATVLSSPTSAQTPSAEKSGDEPDQAIALFDGKTLDGWTDAGGKPISKGWKVEDGVLVRDTRGGAIYSKGQYGDFVLDFEWKIAPGGNGGVKYRIQFYKKGVWGRPGWLGCEYQLLDDAKHRNAKNPKTSAGALYSLYAPNKNKHLKPAGQYNVSRIVVRGSKFEHWLNGKKIVEADTHSDDWKQRIAKSKFRPVEGFAQNAAGRIQLQDHGSKVWFRKITLTPLGNAAKHKKP